MPRGDCSALYGMNHNFTSKMSQIHQHSNIGIYLRKLFENTKLPLAKYLVSDTHFFLYKKPVYNKFVLEPRKIKKLLEIQRN